MSEAYEHPLGTARRLEDDRTGRVGSATYEAMLSVGAQPESAIGFFVD